MDLGFETVGNATLVCYDRGPLLVTDPWLTGHAYFGSWGLSHEIPEAVLEGIRGCGHVWISHGHPDHLSPRSLDLLEGKKILLPDHAGGRIRDGLRERGFDVTVLRNRQWYPLSERIRVLCIADYNQDSILLADIGGKLVYDMNDADDHGWGAFVKQIIRKYDVSFHLQLTGFGDTDMINFWREDGSFITPRAARRRPIGATIARLMRDWGTRYFIPFSSMHTYQRTDSAWASKYKTRLSDYQVGFASERGELLPAFVRYDAINDRVEELNPRENTTPPQDPKAFGDDWAEPLADADREKLKNYFKSIEHLSEFLDFVAFRVGGREHVVEIAHRRFNRGITFEAPRNSLMIAVENEIFDDMLIGNFMKATLHGRFSSNPLYPDFTPYVTKYADNGLAKTNEQLREYFRYYRAQAPLDFMKHRIERRALQLALSSVAVDSPLYTVGARTYHWIKSLTA